jgi:hypothetical protein
MGEMQADFPIWLYIIFGVIYLISRMRKKPAAPTDFPEYGPENPVPNAGKDQSGRTDTSLPKQLTFEELLREISETKAGGKPERKSIPQSNQKSYEEDLEEEEEVVESDQRVTKVYEEAKRQAFYRKSLEETLNVNDTDMRFGKFKEFEKDVSRNLVQEYLTDFKDPAGLRKAVVMSEILKTKF